MSSYKPLILRHYSAWEIARDAILVALLLANLIILLVLSWRVSEVAKQFAAFIHEISTKSDAIILGLSLLT